jgi:hypothetical protein
MRAAGGEQEQQRWDRSMLRALEIIDPLGGDYSDTFAPSPPLLAMVIYAMLPDVEPEHASRVQLLELLKTRPEHGWFGDLLTAALDERGQAESDLGQWLKRMRTEPERYELTIDEDLLPSSMLPDFREPLAGRVEWLFAALEREVAGATL